MQSAGLKDLPSEIASTKVGEGFQKAPFAMYLLNAAILILIAVAQISVIY